MVGCGPQPPDINFYAAALDGKTAAIKQHIAAGSGEELKAEGK